MIFSTIFCLAYKSHHGYFVMDIIYCNIVTDNLCADYCDYLQQHGITIHGVIPYLPAYSVTMPTKIYEELQNHKPCWVQRIIVGHPRDHIENPNSDKHE